MIFGWFRRSASDQHEPDVLVPIVNELILPQEAADSSDPYELIACNIDWINFLFSDGQYMPDEMIQEPIWSYQVDYYLQQVNNGGHGQYVGNSDILNENWRSVEATQRGLAAMGANDFAAIYAGLIALLGANRQRADAIAAGRGFGDIDPAIGTLDDRFFALDGTDRLIAQNRAFLLGLPSLRLVPEEAMDAELERIAGLNPKREERAAAARRGR